MWDYVNAIPESWRYGLIVLLVVVVLVVFAKWASSMHSNSPMNHPEKLKHVLKEATRWQSVSQQDQNAAYAFMHANYAVAYANVVRLLLTDADIRSITGLNMQDLAMELDSTQQQCLQALVRRCPELQPDNQYAVATGYVA